VPTYNTPIKYLREMIDSVVNQSYPHWQLCIADGSGGNKALEKTLKEYADKDKRVKYQILESNRGIAGNTNAALDMADGENLIFISVYSINFPVLETFYNFIKSIRLQCIIMVKKS